jgi:hypothetical protein
MSEMKKAKLFLSYGRRDAADLANRLMKTDCEPAGIVSAVRDEQLAHCWLQVERTAVSITPTITSQHGATASGGRIPNSNGLSEFCFSAVRSLCALA